MSSKDDKFVDAIRQQLDASLDDLDTETRSRLTRARTLAVERGERRTCRLFYWGALPAAGLALCLLVLNGPHGTAPLPQVPEIVVLQMLSTAESLDFYQEEIEFYEWLSEVMALEKEQSGLQRTPAEPAAAKRFVGATERGNAGAQPGTARISWNLSG